MRDIHAVSNMAIVIGKYRYLALVEGVHAHQSLRAMAIYPHGAHDNQQLFFQAHLRSSWTGMLAIQSSPPKVSLSTIFLAPASYLSRNFFRIASPEMARLQMLVLNTSTAKAAMLRRSRPCRHATMGWQACYSHRT